MKKSLDLNEIYLSIMWMSIVLSKYSTWKTLEAGYDFGLQNVSGVPIAVQITPNLQLFRFSCPIALQTIPHSVRLVPSQWNVTLRQMAFTGSAFNADAPISVPQISGTPIKRDSSEKTNFCLSASQCPIRQAHCSHRRWWFCVRRILYKETLACSPRCNGS